MLFPPLCHLEVVGEPKVEMYNRKQVLVVTMKVSINQKASTLQEVLGRRKRILQSIGEGVINDVDFDLGVISKRPWAKSVLKDRLRCCLGRGAEWFVKDTNLKSALDEVLDLKRRAIAEFFSTEVDMNDAKLLGSILAETAQRGQEYIFQALIERMPASLSREVMNSMNPQVLPSRLTRLCDAGVLTGDSHRDRA